MGSIQRKLWTVRAVWGFSFQVMLRRVPVTVLLYWSYRSGATALMDLLSGAGEIRQADFVAAYFQIVGGALSQCLADLDLQLFLFSLCGLDQLGGFLVLLDKGQ